MKEGLGGGEGVEVGEGVGVGESVEEGTCVEEGEGLLADITALVLNTGLTEDVPSTENNNKNRVLSTNW